MFLHEDISLTPEIGHLLKLAYLKRKLMSREHFMFYFVNCRKVAFTELFDYLKVIEIQGKALLIEILLNV